MQIEQRALRFRCGDDWLYGVLTAPLAERAARGVLIVVGGPQYRAGSHRQFTLLARRLAADGIPAMRFDVRGMGDSEGAARGFDAIGDDLRAAIDQFFAVQPGLEQVVLWGLCDAASAILFYAGSDRRVGAIALLNPWARSEGGLARTTLKHYYGRRLLDPALWRKIAGGRFALGTAARSAAQLLARAVRPDAGPGASLSDRMRAGLARFDGEVLLMLSGADLTAREFADVGAASPAWKALLAQPRVTRHLLPGADHTCSRRAWQDQVEAWTSGWLRER